MKYQQRRNIYTKKINQTVEKLHSELDDMRDEHETLLEKQKKEFKEMIEKSMK